MNYLVLGQKLCFG